MHRKPLILLGAGGHCISCIDAIEGTDQWHIEGILNKERSKGDEVLNYPVLGTDEDIDEFQKKGFCFLITVGQIKSSVIRRSLFELLQTKKADVATVVSSLAYVSKHSTLGAGSIVLNYASVSAGASIGVNCIINTFANIEHEVVIGDHSHVSTGAMINGNVTIGKNCFIGSGSVITNGVTIGDDVVVGANSLVLSHIKEGGVYAGSPCRRIRG